MVEQLSTVAESDWNRLAGLSEYSPFLEHEFLCTLEESGAASPARGWYPRHLVLRDEGRLVAAAPLYGKTHSMGEFVFDQGLAQVSMSLEIPYYPKLVATLPFTPAPGYRFLVDPSCDSQEIESVLLDGMRRLRDAGDFASLSILFVDPSWEVQLRTADRAGTMIKRTNSGVAEPDSDPPRESPAGFQRWAHQYFLWENHGYQDFNDYLSRFRKNQRRNIQKERRSIADAGVDIRVLCGSDLNDELMDRMYEFYESTNDNFGPWAAFFLNREWFTLIGRRWKHRILIFAAYLSGRAAACRHELSGKKGQYSYRALLGGPEFREESALRTVLLRTDRICHFGKAEFFRPRNGLAPQSTPGFRQSGIRQLS